MRRAEDEGGGASRSTDPAAGTSSATDVSLREYLMAEIRASRSEFKTGLQHLESSVAAAERSANESIKTALASIDRRFEGVNEFRAALTDLSKTMAARNDLNNLGEKMVASDEALEARFESLYQRNRGDIDLINKRLDTREGAEAGTRLTKGSLYGTATILIAVIGILIVAANYITGH